MRILLPGDEDPHCEPMERDLLEVLDAGDVREAARLAQLTVDLNEGRADLADIVGITDEELEALYVLAGRLYYCGEYEDALTFFCFLCLHRHTDARFFLSLAMTSQMLGDAESALRAYSLAASLKKEDPEISIRIAEALIALNRLPEAESVLGNTLALSTGKAEHDALAWRARLMLRRLKSEGNSRNE